MTRQDIESLLMQIKSFYPRFESVDKRGDEFLINETIVNAWQRKIGWMSIDKALQLLDRWMQSDDGGRAPQISYWIRNGQEQSQVSGTTMKLDQRNSCVIWQPEPGGEKFEILVRPDPRGQCWVDKEGRSYAFAGK